MNTISKSHQRFSERLRNPKVLTHPEEFLEPNYEEVLNFWMILDDLSKEQWRDVNERHVAFINENRSEWDKAVDLACEASREVVGCKYAYEAGLAALDVTKLWAVCWATRELIAMHLILSQQPLTFFEMILEVL
jgi:hypothetical protein